MQIPFHKPYITEDEINEVVDSLKKGWITMGYKTIEFENRFKEYIGSKNAVAVNSCTAGLHLALRAIGLKEGDEVIVPTITFVATAEVVNYFKAKPVLVDVEKDTHLIDVSKIEEKITPKTKAIIPVHYSGQPADMDEILEIAKKYNLFVIEDAAHSLPAWYKGRIVGIIGDITAFSFYATKTLATGEGGMVTTDNDEWADKIRILRLHGISKDAWKRYSKEGSWEYDVLDNGYKYNMTDINAALGLAQLKKLQWMWEKRIKIANTYNQTFKNYEELILYKVKDNRITSWHLYPLKLNLKVLRIDRNRFVEELKARGIGTSVHFIPLYRFSYYRNQGFTPGAYPNSEWVFQRVVSLPIFPGMKKEEIDYIIENIVDLVKKFKR
ncbi:DegT/DnrJ/EryC1/StrS family aminotransferase [Thermodesulfovibrio yellowstonii]|uniref:Spore coat protein n=1 Tax=Thermodesulfovibrio yellowstonii TaxID=28262 RepID=A0A9W6GC28_9BACT|nr:DegT/DnrJ/EryC1/StrS family aminotransferase [Thermodesulfovibrio islandicus]GLI52418.1 spore coat protein [Thermodesulfovibrio islandicus]